MPDHQLVERLHDLGRDVDGVPLPAAGDVRARGERRARRQKAALGAGSALVVVLVALGVSGVLGAGRDVDVRPAGPEVTVTRTVTVTPSPLTTIAARPAGAGSVPRAAFLPGAGWTGPDLDEGVAVDVVAVREADGSAAFSPCDVDAALRGDVGVVEAVHPDGNHVGYQQVRLESTVAAAQRRADATRVGLVTCGKRLGKGLGRSTPVAQLQVRDATGSVDVVHTVLPGQQDQWDVVARQGRAVTVVTVQVWPTTTVSAGALRRVAAAARAQLAAAVR